MALHLIKLAVGIENLAHLRDIHALRAKGFGGRSYTETRMIPRRGDELLDGGSLYWVIKGIVSARQPILALNEGQDQVGKAFCQIELGDIVPVTGQPRRPFQGWRYLKPDDAPADADNVQGIDDIPDDMAAELRTLGLL